MKSSSLPALDGRYWAAILAASLVGTTFGDFVSQTLHLGFLKGLVPLGALLAITFYAERRAKVPSETYYWTAIVITRTGATNLADLVTHQLKLNYLGVDLVLALLLFVTLLSGRTTARGLPVVTVPRGTGNRLPDTNARYWTAILVASVLGTTTGDSVSDGLGLGVGKGAVVLGLILAAILFAQGRSRKFDKAWYWVTIATVRTAGTVMGDFLSTDGGLNLGFLCSAVCSAALLVAILCLWRNSLRMHNAARNGEKP